MKTPVAMKVNGQAYAFVVEPSQTLLEVLRENLKLIKTKEGCGVGECGSCAVILNRKAVNSCLVLAVDAASGIAHSSVDFNQALQLDLVAK
jgi:carbon-monoxide dehydrogenase small subunit